MLHREHHLIERIAWLRAAALGANDGINSTAIRHRHPGLMLLQHRNDLLLAEPDLLHLHLLPTESNSNRAPFRGQRHVIPIFVSLRGPNLNGIAAR